MEKYVCTVCGYIYDPEQGDPENSVDAFLAAGHVCTIMGEGEYQKIAKKYNVPIVITGFEPVDLLQGILMAVNQLEQGNSRLENQYRCESW